MKTLVFATNNPYKLEEIRASFEAHQGLAGRYKIIGLKEIGFDEEIPETKERLEENALEKALYVKEKTGYDCFADDTGLEINALGGKPGVYSARYAGEGCSFDDNIDKVLKEMTGVADRKARFRTVIVLLMDGRECYYEGCIEGEILTERHGLKGFGYDPVFRPMGWQKTFAEMDLQEKNAISHRGLAFGSLLRALSQ